ncbi:MAG: hypothetical protein GY847_01385 [Proteobacteria bacterium]|nr:hypothetical protein [Pseudomonadota bacterium]
MKYRLLTDRAVLKRPSNLLLDTIDGETSITFALDRDLDFETYLQFDAESSGIAYISGLVDGASQTERLLLPSSGFAQSQNAFSVIAGISFVSVSGELSIKSVKKSGQPDVFYETIAETVPCKVFEKQKMVVPSEKGEDIGDRYNIYVDWSSQYRIYNRDLLYVFDPNTIVSDGLTYRLNNVVNQKTIRGRPSFYKAEGELT